MLPFFGVKVDVLLKPRGIDQILTLDGLSLFSNRDLGKAVGYDSVVHTPPCLLTLGSVCSPVQLKYCIYQQSFCSTHMAYHWILLSFLELGDSHCVSHVVLEGILGQPLILIPFYHLLYTFLGRFI